MYKIVIFAVKTEDNKKPSVKETDYNLCVAASFEYPEFGVCVVRAIIDERINIDEVAKTLPIVEYDTSSYSLEFLEKKCVELNGGAPIWTPV